MSWWTSSNVYRNFGTTVHEECHAYSFTTKWPRQKIYIGDKKHVKVRCANVFKSKVAASSVPSRLRTDRFRTYMSGAKSSLDSNVYGTYGLLNEFMAYCWGFNANVKLYGLANAKRRGGCNRSL